MEKRNVPKLRFKGFEDEWKYMKLDELCKIYDGIHQTPQYTNEGIKFISVENIKNIYDSNKYISKENYDKNFKIKPKLNDIFMTRITAGEIGATAIVDKEEELAYYVSLALIRILDDRLKSLFLTNYMASQYFKKELNKRIIHVAFPKKINLRDINECKFSSPSVNEQEKIANFLSNVDNIIEEQEGKVKDLEQYKKGMMQKIFKQEVRFRDDNGGEYPEWSEKKLGDYILEYNKITTKNNQYEVLTSSRKGLFLQKNYFNKQIASEDNIGYNIVPRGYFTYRHMSDDSIFYFNINNLVDFGIVSTLYPVFTTSKNMDSIFLRYYLNESNYFKKYCLLQKQGGSRTYMYLKKLKEFKGKFPCLEEQTKIANFLSKIDNIIEEENKKLEDLRLWKKGLLQQMFV